MSHHKSLNNESQDARRRDKHNEVHPDEKHTKQPEKSHQSSDKPSNSSHHSKK